VLHNPVENPDCTLCVLIIHQMSPITHHHLA
jgi:hypothetical protein